MPKKKKNYKQEKIRKIKLDIERIKKELKNEPSHEEFITLERRVALLESRR